jgi:CubicO group peptidase (beta-lactamase class C family)
MEPGHRWFWHAPWRLLWRLSWRLFWRPIRRVAVAWVWTSALALGWSSAAAQAPSGQPDAVGLSASRLQRVEAFIARQQADGKLAGAVTVVARRDRLVVLKAQGFADLATQRALRNDDIFQIQSMTQPITAVAVLMLLEEGRLLLSDPIAHYLPEFADMKVAVAQADAPDGFVLVPARRGITIHDLLTHRAGLVGVPPSNSPAHRLRRQALQALPADGNFTLEQFVKNLAASPLDSQPGSTVGYGWAADVLGRLVEVVSGRSLAEFFAQRIFEPLGMADTSFVVPAAKRQRVVTAYGRATDGKLAPVAPFSMAPTFFSASGNLFSTPADYLRFCQMLLDSGSPGGSAGGNLAGQPVRPRLLGRKSVELMTARHVEAWPAPHLAGQHVGLGVAVRSASGESGLIGSAGAYGWSGGYNTYFRIDPQEQMVLMLFVQQAYTPGDQALQFGFHNTVMQAIID